MSPTGEEEEEEEEEEEVRWSNREIEKAPPYPPFPLHREIQDPFIPLKEQKEEECPYFPPKKHKSGIHVDNVFIGCFFSLSSPFLGKRKRVPPFFSLKI